MQNSKRNPKNPNKIMKKSEVRELIDKLAFFYDCDLNFLKSYKFYFNESRGKVYISNANIENLNLRKISGKGLYFGTLHDNDRFRLSIEGSHFISPKKNFVKIDNEKLKSYLSGENLFKEEIIELNWQDKCPFLIVIYDGESLGCVNVKGDELISYVPKSRRLSFNKLF